MRRFAVLSLLLTATLAACGPGDPGAPAARAEPDAALPRQATAEELATLRRAEEILERRCMTRAGFDLPAAPEPVRTGPEPPPMALVLADLVWAREHGYGARVRTPEETARLRADDPVGDHLRALTPERRAEALRAWQGGGVDTVEVTLPGGMTTGRSTRGCTSEARGELYGDFRTWFGADAVDRGVTALAMSRAQADPAFTKALRGWSDCMAGRGLPHESPQRLRAALGDEAPEAKEIEYAVAEAACAVGSGLAEVATDVEERHLAQVREQYLADVINARRMRLAALPEADRIVRDEESSRLNTHKKGTR
ncbi:hypothetical protein SSP24_00100 [Streptomyces spinoverrucosus]|uniref:Lipoprotein n=1 Tax=Streptomyces spinoverrucosus TaxID=284043 RepID=A0A4Y3V7E1_9ACTN|nr:hypothetical protein [Streptomyces spinoverrucosus]GEC02355.1 hypothetical protein SSP24_00100 [Streptomyces spinoverrucosus]GHB43558.1 hypothetical protein GCM10010397_12480 [Streptomyces spinoverrucosus]